MQSNILDAVFLNNAKKKSIETQTKLTPYQTCFGDKIIQNCEEIKNSECKCINNARQQDRTTYETITVGLELPNSSGQMIRFVPRYVTIITHQF